MPGDVKQRIGRRLRVLQADVLALELHFQRRVVPGEFQQIVHARRIGIPIAVVDDLGEDEIVAAGGRGLVIDLRRTQEPAQLERAEDVGDQVRADLPGLVDHHARAARMLVAVPAAGQIARRKDHARAAAEVDPFQARSFDEGRAVALLVRQIAQLVVRGIDRLVAASVFCSGRPGKINSISRRNDSAKSFQPQQASAMIVPPSIT